MRLPLIPELGAGLGRPFAPDPSTGLSRAKSKGSV
jgi:hypothetical protein